MIIGEDIEKEVDRVPIEEALMISDTMNRRQLFLEVLKRPDVEDYMGGIRSAMAQEDSEVVHYAASYITDTIANIKIRRNGSGRSMSKARKLIRFCCTFSSVTICFTKKYSANLSRKFI